MRRHQRYERTVEKEGEAATAPAEPLGPAQVLALQRSAGNAAVARALLQRAPQDPTVTSVADPRYEGLGEFEWKVKFGLPLPAAQDGAIVQEIDGRAGSHNQKFHYWEAWPVRRGAQAPEQPSGDHHDAYGWAATGPAGYTWADGTARFYEEDVKQHGFETGHRFAGELLATDTKPSFWQDDGTHHDLGLKWEPLESNDESLTKRREKRPVAEWEKWTFETVPQVGDWEEYER